jgi:hypothetical protein
MDVGARFVAAIWALVGTRLGDRFDPIAPPQPPGRVRAQPCPIRQNSV